MNYKKGIPHRALADSIDCYWSIKGSGSEMHAERIFPDGCPGLVLNVGGKCITDNGLVTMQSGSAYLVGAMTTFKETYLNSEHHLIGVCFKPGTFTQFYNHLPLAEITEQTVELEKALAPDTSKMEEMSFTELNTFFLKRLNTPKQDIITIVECIKRARGKVRVDALAKKNHTTPRQLERTFHKHIGLTPKAFINIIRFQHVLPMISDNKKQSLLDVAIEYGYYDHAHLTNDIKRYTGVPPLQL